MSPQTVSVDLRSQAGFKQMYGEHLGFVYSVLQRLGAPGPQLEDLCHDVFMTAFRKREDFDSSRPLKPWLFGLAFRLMLNVKRKANVGGDDAPLDTLAASGNPELAYQERQARSALSKAIDGLEPDRRAVFVLHDLEGQVAPEIARALEIPLNTAYSRLRLARADILQATQRLRAGDTP